VLMNRAADDPQGQARLSAFQQALQQLGWIDGRNVRIDIRWHENDADRARRYVQELVALAPDILLADGTASATALQHVTRTLPIVFAAVPDPVGAGFVESLARPGGNITGFMSFEYGGHRASPGQYRTAQARLLETWRHRARSLRKVRQQW